ncbi:hypothetical protein LO763_10400 [Glycomyces sp. A-F 0318]|uniref:hypothetical protein n=1 Tax=Glycomyces amatae TaxID=2881355 RepID=UPI001E646EB6|nr:hypothetical protein [Glycomyces amatae]MCD0444033.1 hypothetical protein [Glycomyces amatae]
MRHDKRPWPGDPKAAWAAAAGAPPLERPPVPDPTSSLERFTARVVIENERRFYGGMGILIGAMGAGTIVLFSDFRDRVGELGAAEAFFLGNVWYKNALAFAAAALILGGLVKVVRAPRAHAARVRRLYALARETGTLGVAYVSDLKLPQGENSGTVPVAMVADARTGAAQAGRLLRAVDLWAAGLDADPKARSALHMRLTSHLTVRTEAVFGAEAAGGYLTADRHSAAGPGWRLIMPGRSEVRDPSGIWEVLRVEQDPPAA